jgi:hypothetical protein
MERIAANNSPARPTGHADDFAACPTGHAGSFATRAGAIAAHV